MPLPREGLPDKGKPDGTHNQVLYLAPLYSTQNQSVPSRWDVVKPKNGKIRHHKMWEPVKDPGLLLGGKRGKEKSGVSQRIEKLRRMEEKARIVERRPIRRRISAPATGNRAGTSVAES